MGRRPNPQRKIDLLDEILDYVTTHGLSDLSLRPLAKALGTSTYTLTYQFGSKEEMVVDLMAHAEAKHLAAMDRLPADRTVQGLLEALFDAASDEPGQQWNRLLLEMVTMIVRDEEIYGRFDGAIVRDRVDRFQALLIETGLDAQKARRVATVLSAVLQGLIVDLLATGDTDRVREALVGLRDQYDSLIGCVLTSA